MLPKKAPPPLRNPGYATAQDSGKLQLSNTLRIGPWKIFQKENAMSHRQKKFGTTALN